MKMIRTFVYGTLKRGYGNHHWLNGIDYSTGKVYDSQFLGTGKVNAELQLGYLPYLYRKDGEAIGEVYLIPEPIYNHIKNMECGAGYYEEEIDVTMLDGTVEKDCKVFFHSGKLYGSCEQSQIIKEYGVDKH